MRFIGGVPPTFENIKTYVDLLDLFVDLLFVNRTQLTHKKNLSVFLLILLRDFIISFLYLLVMNRPVST